MNINVLSAISKIVTTKQLELQKFYKSKNRANNMGEALEEYIKDMFAGTIDESDEQKRLLEFEKVFSYKGNQNNPPDIIISGGDAIEVKKIESVRATLALNSSYPKAKLFSNSSMITTACRDCEKWEEKDILYVVGVVNKDSLSRLFFVYGVDYAASAEIYERIRSIISTGITTISDVEFSSTKELGRVNCVDPLGITYLRIRGMWGIENPAKVFSYIYTPSNAKFELVAIINNDKYMNFPHSDRKKLEIISKTVKDFNIQDVKIKTPDNPAILKKAKLITFSK